MDYVLVHGTTQSSSGWDRLVDVLETAGHRAHLLDLPCDRPAFSATDYAAVGVRQTRGQLDEAPVVVGHSGAGVLLPEIGWALGASQLIWVAAVVPDMPGGASLRDDIAAAGPAMFNEEWLELREPPTADFLAAAYFLFHDCTFDTLRWAVSTLQLFYPDAAYDELPTRELPAPSTYILPTQDRTLRPDWMKAAARRRLQVEPIELEAGHCPHVSQPELLAQVLIS